MALVGLYNSHTKSIQSLGLLVILLGPFHFAGAAFRTGRLPRHKCLWGIPDNSPVLALGSFTHCLRPPRNDNINKKHPTGGYFLFIWWPWSDSNRHSLLNLILSQARLPIPPRGRHIKSCNYYAAFFASTFFTKRALRFALCAGFLAGFSALPTFFSIAFLIAAISSVKRETGLDIT